MPIPGFYRWQRRRTEITDGLQQVHHRDKRFRELAVQIGRRLLHTVADVLVRAAAEIDVIADPDQALLCAFRIQAGKQQALVADIAQLVEAQGPGQAVRGLMGR